MEHSEFCDTPSTMTLAHSAFPADSLDSIQGPMAGQSPYQLSWRSTEWLTRVKWPLGGAGGEYGTTSPKSGSYNLPLWCQYFKGRGIMDQCRTIWLPTRYKGLSWLLPVVTQRKWSLMKMCVPFRGRSVSYYQSDGIRWYFQSDGISLTERGLWLKVSWEVYSKNSLLHAMK